jgi:DNA-directed RNA polymerase specialized sigma24 family protein
LRPWNEETIRTIHDLVDYIISEADVIELPERKRYAQAVVNANLPPDLVGEIFIRGWKGIARYDHGQGSLEKWLWGFVRPINCEDWRRSRTVSLERHDVEAFEDRSIVSPVNAVSDEQLDDELREIRAIMHGFVRVDEMTQEITLLDLQKQAVRTVINGLSEKAFTVVQAVLCQDQDRNEVAESVGFANRDGVDHIISRFQSKVKSSTDDLRKKYS